MKLVHIISIVDLHDERLIFLKTEGNINRLHELWVEAVLDDLGLAYLFFSLLFSLQGVKDYEWVRFWAPVLVQIGKVRAGESKN